MRPRPAKYNFNEARARQHEKWRLNRYSFHWVGRTEKGVSRWVGSPSGPPAWSVWLFNGLALLFTLLSLGFLFTAARPASFVFGGMVLLYAGLGWWASSLRGKIQAAEGAEKLAERLGVDCETLKRVAAERGIKPRFNINGEDLYAPEDLEGGEAAVLLRAAQAPPDAARLLHPAGSVDGETDQLPRVPIEPVREVAVPTVVEPVQELNVKRNVEERTS